MRVKTAASQIQSSRRWTGMKLFGGGDEKGKQGQDICKIKIGDQGDKGKKARRQQWIKLEEGVQW